jgi:hypothetical protein
MTPSLRFRSKKDDALGAARIALRAIKDSSEAFPPLRSVVSAALVVWDTSDVSLLAKITSHVTHTSLQRVKSNKKDCRRLASRAVEQIHGIWRQTKDYGEEVPPEVQRSLTEIQQ